MLSFIVCVILVCLMHCYALRTPPRSYAKVDRLSRPQTLIEVTYNAGSHIRSRRLYESKFNGFRSGTSHKQTEDSGHTESVGEGEPEAAVEELEGSASFLKGGGKTAVISPALDVDFSRSQLSYIDRKLQIKLKEVEVDKVAANINTYDVHGEGAGAEDVHCMLRGLRSRTQPAVLHYLRMSLGVVLDPRVTIAIVPTHKEMDTDTVTEDSAISSSISGKQKQSGEGIEGIPEPANITTTNTKSNTNSNNKRIVLSYKEIQMLLVALLEVRADASTTSAVYARLANQVRLHTRTH